MPWKSLLPVFCCAQRSSDKKIKNTYFPTIELIKTEYSRCRIRHVRLAMRGLLFTGIFLNASFLSGTRYFLGIFRISKFYRPTQSLLSNLLCRCDWAGKQPFLGFFGNYERSDGIFCRTVVVPSFSRVFLGSREKQPSTERKLTFTHLKGIIVSMGGGSSTSGSCFLFQS